MKFSKELHDKYVILTLNEGIEYSGDIQPICLPFKASPYSTKMIGKMQSMGGFEEPSRDFKKNRNLSVTTNSNNGPMTINIPQGMSNYSSPNSTAINSPTIQMSPVQLSNPNMIQPTNNKINGSYPPEVPKTPTQVKVGEEHRMVIEGVRLSMDIIESKLPNHMGYAHLLLTRTLSILSDLALRNIKGKSG